MRFAQGVPAGEPGKRLDVHFPVGVSGLPGRVRGPQLHGPEVPDSHAGDER